MGEFNPGSIVNGLFYAFTGILTFVIVFVIFDRLTPFNLWREILQEKNVALAVLLGAFSIGVCLIIAAAVH